MWLGWRASGCRTVHRGARGLALSALPARAFYREAALDEPSECVHGPHLTAPCGPFAEVA